MIKKIIVLPRRVIDDMASNKLLIPDIDKDWALISIYSKDILSDEYKENFYKLNCKDIISSQFEDITGPIEGEEHILFDKEKARQIISFIDKVKDLVSILVIHCHAGVSRSGACGLFACRYLGLNETEFRKNNRPMPNTLVLRTLTEVSGMNDDYVKYWENLYTNKRFVSLKERRIKFF